MFEVSKMTFALKNQLNERLQKLCDQARQTNWNDHSQAIFMTKLPKSHALNMSKH